MNCPDNVVGEMLEGFLGAYDRYYEKVPGVNGLALKKREKR